MRTFLWVVALGAAGVGGGSLLGTIAVGEGLRPGAGNFPRFASLSANPDALVTGDTGISPPCPGCADSYGVAARLQAEREQPTSDPFRRLGEVDIDVASLSEPADDYHYGGRLPDPAPRDRPPIAMSVAFDTPPAPVPIDAPRAAQQKGPDETPEPPATPE